MKGVVFYDCLVFPVNCSSGNFPSRILMDIVSEWFTVIFNPLPSFDFKYYLGLATIRAMRPPGAFVGRFYMESRSLMEILV